ncbi:MAG: gliding motility-associated protein GldE [Candidatus Methylacidiphilales bacterium]
MEPPLNLQFVILSYINANLQSSDWPAIIGCVIAIVIFILLSALFSGSENALFSLNKPQIEELTDNESATAKAITFLISNPKKLLATILIGNTFINVAMVMVSTVLLTTIFDFEHNPVFGFLIEVVFVTFMIVLFGEVIPKIYAVQNNSKVSALVAVFMFYMYKLFRPLVFVLENSTSIIDKRVTKRGHILSVDELSHAIDITTESDAPKQEKSILKGIVNFVNTNVTEIMCQRPDISAIDIETNFTELLQQIDELGYSRIPVFQDSLDEIKGILSIKDILPHIHQSADFKWQELARPAFYVPESKKIDDLLKDFQNKRTHMAIVVDEFGGTSGLVTMEDILEEVFGEINDEFDEDEIYYSKLDENTFVFEAKMLINDACKYMELEQDIFDEVRNEADTLAGLILELNGNMPKQNQELKYHPLTFKIEAVDKRRIKRIKVIIER